MNKIKIDNYYKPESKTLRLDETNLNQTDINAMQVLLRKNQELKEKLDKYENPEDMTLMMMWCTEKVKDENQALKKQVENYKKLGFKHLVDKNNNLETQQKEFINYLEDEIKTLEKDIFETIDDMDKYMKEVKSLIIEEILQKYKSIIGNDINVGSKGGNKDE